MLSSADIMDLVTFVLHGAIRTERELLFSFTRASLLRPFCPLHEHARSYFFDGWSIILDKKLPSKILTSADGYWRLHTEDSLFNKCLAV